jgi:hypothetical protein
MVAAPILAVALALCLAAAISYLPVTPTPSVQTTSLQSPNVGNALGVPTPLPTYAPMPVASASVADITWPFFIFGAIIIGILAVVLLFREK